MHLSPICELQDEVPIGIPKYDFQSHNKNPHMGSLIAGKPHMSEFPSSAPAYFVSDATALFTQKTADPHKTCLKGGFIAERYAVGPDFRVGPETGGCRNNLKPLNP